MKIALIQIDGKMPNLALMKLARYHRNRGDEVVIVDLSTIKADQWYGSKIFMGGSGFDLNAKLPDDIECEVPDYELFNIDYSIGFTQRGCIRDCGFCLVREKEGKFQEVENWQKDVKHLKYICMDNNFFASKIWREKLQYFIDNHIKVCFTQGLDIRLITHEKAKLLSKVDFCNMYFNSRKIYFAWDNPDDELIFRKKLGILIQYIKPCYVMIYMLVDYNTDFVQDWYRFQTINSYGCDPFVMVYNNAGTKLKREFARWVNRRLYKIMSFKDYMIKRKTKSEDKKQSQIVNQDLFEKAEK